MVLQRIAADRHSIGMHGQSHRKLRQLPPCEWQAEILPCQATVSRVRGRQPMWLRAPFGAVSDEQIEWCAARSIRIANWLLGS